MTDIVEKVARASEPELWQIFDRYRAWTGKSDEEARADCRLDLKGSMDDARAAIKATIEHLRDNMPSLMLDATRLAEDSVDWKMGVINQTQAVLSQALREIEET